MELNRKHIKIFVWIYLSTYVLNFFWNLVQGVSFTGINPIIITNTLDATLHLILATPFLPLLMRSEIFRIIFDSLALLLPALLCICYLNNKKFTGIIAVFTAIYCLVYYLLLCAVSYYSSEVFICWTIIPLIFITTKPLGFYYRLQVIRLIFVLLFFSSALWKLSTCTIFHSGQMVAILFHQHISILQYKGADLFSQVAYYLIVHPLTAQVLYVTGFLLEFSFVVAFFTKRFDKILIILLILFLISDFLLMGINYFPWLSFIGCFYLSALQEPKKETFQKHFFLKNSIL